MSYSKLDYHQQNQCSSSGTHTDLLILLPGCPPAWFSCQCSNPAERSLILIGLSVSCNGLQLHAEKHQGGSILVHLKPRNSNKNTSYNRYFAYAAAGVKMCHSSKMKSQFPTGQFCAKIVWEKNAFLSICKTLITLWFPYCAYSWFYQEKPAQ